MKKIIFAIALSVGFTASAGIHQLSVRSGMSSQTFDMSKVAEVTFLDVDREYPVDRLPEIYNAFKTVNGDVIDFGWPSYMMMLDTRGQDMPSMNSGYNWFLQALQMTDGDPRYYVNYRCWLYNYNTIGYANKLLVNTNEQMSATDMFNRAQAMAYRAMCYFNLAQTYQFTYAKAPNALCVPLITESNWVSAKEGVPCVTVAEVYEQILSDYTDALDLLKKAAAEGVTREKIFTNPGEAKTFFNEAAVLGMRARANLVMQRWQAAADDAAQALNYATASGMKAYSRAQASVPAFYDITDANVVIGIYANMEKESYRYQNNYDNFASHFNTFALNSYTAVGIIRCISPTLYNMIPDTDCRKGWWLNEMAQYSSQMPENYAEFLNNPSNFGSNDLLPYTQVKFGLPNGPSNQHDQSMPLLRVEELYLIQAEARGMFSLADGNSLLTDFVKTYRDPQYNCNESTITAFQDAVWLQRRIELWGEGMAFWDLMRLQKGINRVGAGYDPIHTFVISPDDPILIYDIPSPIYTANQLMNRKPNGAQPPIPVNM